MTTRRHIPALLLLAVILCVRPAAGAQKDADAAGPEPYRDGLYKLYDFEDGAADWKATDEAGAQGGDCRVAAAPAGGSPALCVEGGLPAGATVVPAKGLAAWGPFTDLLLRVYVPEDAPETLQVIVHVKDAEYRYYQHFRPGYLRCGEWTDLKLDLTAGSTQWEPEGHYKPWDGYCRQSIRELGVKFIGRSEYGGALLVDDVLLARDDDSLPTANTIYNLRSTGLQVGRFEKFEVSFNLARTYENPFDPEQVDVRGKFVRPDGSMVAVPGFFYQGYVRRMENGAERLVAMGRSQWKARFAPMQQGTYQWHVEVNDGETIRSAVGTFRCVPSENHGFVRVSKADPDYFEFDDGAFYFPIGHNIAAVHDARAAKRLHVNLPAEQGTYAHDRFLSRMAANGENFGRVWMTPWSFGIEWSPTYESHYRGLGRYSLHNAWRLDHVVETAGRNGIYLMLLFTSHGEVGEVESDFRGQGGHPEWGSPYWADLGGPLPRAIDLYTNREAVKYYKRKVRYIMARWGYATSIMAWEILNEADLAFFKRSDANVYGERVADFVREVILHLRLHDPARHLTTSGFYQHWTPHARPTLLLKEMDFFAGHRFDPDLSSQIASDMRYIRQSFDKVFFVTEAGLTAFAADADLTARTMHATLWQTYMLPLPGTACPWWWVLIDERDLYGHFGAMAAFASGEDRRGQGYQQLGGTVKDQGAGRQLQVRALGGQERLFGWVFDPDAFSAAANWTEHKSGAADATIAGVANGAYTIEIWDTRRGEVTATLEATSENSRLMLRLPPFTDDVAFKAFRK